MYRENNWDEVEVLHEHIFVSVHLLIVLAQEQYGW